MNKSSPPKVSVIMGVFNGGNYLDAAIASIVEQTFTDFEFIIIDDCSTDDSPAILKQWAAKEPRIVVFKNPENIGLTKTLNFAINKACGEWVARQDADDISLKHRLAKQVAFLNNNPEVGLLGTGSWIIDENGKRDKQPRVMPKTHTLISWHKLLLNPFCHSTTIFKRTLALEHPYDETIPYTQDFELWGRMLKTTIGANLEEPLIETRFHNQRLSFTKYKLQQEIGYKIIDNNLAQLLPSRPWSHKSLPGLCNLVKNSWPTDEESATHWQLIIKLFKEFSINDNLDKSTLRAIKHQLLNRLALRITTKKGTKQKAELMLHCWQFAGLQCFTAIVKNLYKRLVNRFIS
ncbi:MAG: glycosyltransferase [Magnetococcales bacterium]|nr:glycosyltransferase [Magnetococcales bacterium]